MQWKLEELLAAADAYTVARAIGIQQNRCGATVYIENLDGRQEKNIQHNQLFHDGCYDYSSGKGRNTYSMVRDFFQNVQNRSLTHDEICEIIADTCGGADQYVIRPGKKKRSMPFPLTKEELELIGLNPKNAYNKVVVSYSFEPDEEHDDRDETGWAKTKPLPSISMYTLYKENPELFWEIVKGKTRECIEKQMSDYKYFKNRMSDCALRQAILSICEERFNQATALAGKLNQIQAKKKAA